MNLHPWIALASSRQQTGHEMSQTHCVEGRAPGDGKDSTIEASIENKGIASRQCAEPWGSEGQRWQWFKAKGTHNPARLEAKTASNMKARVG